MKTRTRNKILKQTGANLGFSKEHLNEEIPNKKIRRNELIALIRKYIQNEMDYAYRRYYGF